MSIRSKIQNKVGVKPIPLRAIFILNALKVILAFIFFGLAASGKLSIEKTGSIDSSIILMTAIAYTIIFVAMVISILKKKLIVLRSLIIIDFVVSIPAQAIIGFVIAILSFVLTFHKKVQAYFKG